MGSSRREGVPAHVNLSASSMLMIAMQYTSNPGKPPALTCHGATCNEQHRPFRVRASLGRTDDRCVKKKQTSELKLIYLLLVSMVGFAREYSGMFEDDVLGLESNGYTEKVKYR